jgi:hypothetical protein
VWPTIGTPQLTRRPPSISFGPHPCLLQGEQAALQMILARFAARAAFFSAKAAFRHPACSWRSMQLQSMRPTAIDVVLAAHFTTFTSMVAAGRRAGNGRVAIGWRVENANIVCVILQGSLQSLCEAIGSSVWCMSIYLRGPSCSHSCSTKQPQNRKQNRHF